MSEQQKAQHEQMPVPSTTDVVVVGGGIAGLCAAIAAADAGSRVLVLEAHEPGGRASTVERDGFHLNVGGHALYRGGYLTAMLAKRGVELPGGIVAGKSIGVFVDGAIRQVEMTAFGLLRNQVLRRRSRMRMAALFAGLARIKPEQLVGIPVGEWLGDEPDDVQRFMEMFVRLSTYTHAPDLFDSGAAVMQLQLATKGVRYLDGGWAQLIKALQREAERAGAIIIGHTEVQRVHSSHGRVEVVIGEHIVRAGAAVIASGGPDLATRLTGEQVRDRDALTGPIAANCLDLALRNAHNKLVLGMDQPFYLSAHAPLAALAPEGGGLVSLMRYLAPGESAGEPAAARTTLRDLARLAGIDDDDVLFERALHRMVVTHGAPAAGGGGLRGRPTIAALGQPGIFVAGDWVGPSGLLADASCASGEEAGREASKLCARIQA